MSRPRATFLSQHLTACLECEDELAAAWCEECRTSLCEECDLHQHHPKSLRREHVRTPIKSSDAPASSVPRVGLLSKAFARGREDWASGETGDVSAEEGPAGSCLTSENSGDFSSSASGLKLESGTSHHALKSKRKHKKKKRGKSKEHQEKGRGEDVGDQLLDSSTVAENERRESNSKGKSAEKDGDSAGSSSFENRSEPVWKRHKSSLKGSHEAAGEGPRQSLHVHWSPDVKDHTAENHSPSYGSPRRFVPFISNRRKKYAEKHHKKHHKGAAEQADKRGKGKGRKNHEPARPAGTRKVHPESAPGASPSDASESADSDAFSPVWPRESSDKSEGTSDDSSFEDKMEPHPRAPEVQLQLPEGRNRKEDGGDYGTEEESGAALEAEGNKLAEIESGAIAPEGAGLKAIPFGEIVSSSGAEDTGEESVTEDESMAGGMDLDSSETDVPAAGAREAPPARSWKWFERFMGKKKGDSAETKGLALEKKRPAGPGKGRGDCISKERKDRPASSPGVVKSPLSNKKGSKRGLGNAGEDAVKAHSEATVPMKELMESEGAGALETARGRVDSGKQLAASGDLLRAACEYEAAIRLFRSQSSGREGRRALEGEAQAWVEIAALQKREGNYLAAGRSYLAAVRVYQKLGMDDEVGGCLQQARELQKRGVEEDLVTGDVESEGFDSGAKKVKQSEEERQAALAAEKNDSKRGERELGNSEHRTEQAKVQGTKVTVNDNRPPVQSGSTKQVIEQGLVYSKEEGSGPVSKKGSKKKGKGPAAKAVLEASVTEMAPRSSSEKGVPAKAEQSVENISSNSQGRLSENGDPSGRAVKDGLESSASPDTIAAIARSRQSGAAAVASGDTEKGRVLLAGALVAARRAGVKAEEARCQRLLADSQSTEEQRVRALELAVQGLRVSGLKLEEAEALYRLADAKLTLYIGNKAAIQAAVAGLQGQEDVAMLEAARKDLQSAAGILQAADLWGGSEAVSEAPPRDVLSPTRTNRPEVVTIPAQGRVAARNGRGAENENGGSFLGKGNKMGIPKYQGPVLSKATDARGEKQVRSLRELYGAVCQSAGKASILLGEMAVAKGNFQEALSNKDWAAKHGDEAKRVQEIMSRLPR